MPVSGCVAIIQRIIIRCHSLGVCMFSPPALRVFNYTFDYHSSFDDGQQTPSWVGVWIGAIAWACGVQAVDCFVKLFMLWHADVRWKDFDGQWAVGGLLGKSIQLCRGRVPRNYGGWLACEESRQKQVISRQAAQRNPGSCVFCCFFPLPISNLF